MSDYKVTIVDEAIISFAADMIAGIKLSYNLDQRGIGEKEILNSVEINAEQKILLLKHIEKEKSEE